MTWPSGNVTERTVQGPLWQGCPALSFLAFRLVETTLLCQPNFIMHVESRTCSGMNRLRLNPCPAAAEELSRILSGLRNSLARPRSATPLPA